MTIWHGVKIIWLGRDTEGIDVFGLITQYGEIVSTLNVRQLEEACIDYEQLSW